ncbi:MAG: alginate export family protein [Pseudomonadota bacterium]|nr:alginate export family protein [Pseudomonadota bacterium]
MIASCTPPGFPVYRDPAKAQFDFELESIFQFGESRASAATDVVDLDHFAHMQHIQAGYTFDAPWSPRVLAQYDYASG